MKLTSIALCLAAAGALALLACSRLPVQPQFHSLSGHVRLIGYLVHDDGTFAGNRVVEDADGVAVELTHGPQTVAHALTVSGRYSFSGLVPGDYVARAHVLDAIVDSTRRMTIATTDVVSGDTLVLIAVGDIRPVPNPFDTSTVIYFALSDTETVDVRVLDLAGNLVRPLWSGLLQAGLKSFTWKGDDVTGQPASPTMFWATVQGAHDARAHLVFRCCEKRVFAGW